MEAEVAGEVVLAAAVFVEGALQGVVAVVVVSGVVAGVAVSGEEVDHRGILCNVFHISAVIFLRR